MSKTTVNEETNTLWDNPMIRSAIKAMSPEELQKYKEIGESLYGNIDFEGSKVINNIPPPMEEAVAYVSESLKSGLHPSMLEENEVALLTDVYGDKWYERWGYTKDNWKTIE